MKIPETSANVGAYYGNEENGQWQPNGVIIDNGVGGGVVGSGDAGHRPPVYPVHIPRGHIPGGYVMAGSYYPGAAYPAPQDNFEDYMWMENEEEFDKQVMQQLEEEALMEQCIEAMLEDEQREQRQRPVSNGHNHFPMTGNGSASLSLEEAVSRSTLNPLAAEFVPNRARPSEETQEVTKTTTEVESAKEVSPSPQEMSEPDEVDSKPASEESKTEEPTSVPPVEPPEVSAADILPIDKDKKKEVKKDAKTKTEVKKIIKSEVKKTKPAPVKSEIKVPTKKKEVKVVKSEVKEEEVPVIELKQSSPPPTEDSSPGIKPINYAAAAKANKPKKASSPETEKPQPLKTEKPTKPIDKEKKPQIKDKVKTDKPTVQRKNSTK